MSTKSVLFLLTAAFLAIGVATFIVLRHLIATEQYASVLDFGARADGLTDDGAAFERAFEDAAAKGVAVYIPRRTYIVNRELHIRSGMVIRSDGATIRHANDAITTGSGK